MAAGADFLKTLLVIEKFCKPFVPFLTILRNETFLQKQKMQCECVQCERPLSEMSVSGHYELRSLTPILSMKGCVSSNQNFATWDLL